MTKLLPSTNPCEESKLLDYAKELYDLSIDYLHCDVMNGVFVENKCLEYSVLRNVRDNCNIGLDIHLMVDNTYKTVLEYSKLKPNIITIHYESPRNIKEFNKVFKYLKSKDIMIGLAIKPHTPVAIIERFLDKIDLLLIMSVEPGKSGQKFIEESLEKIKEAKNLIGDRNIIIEVDGGINEDNYKSIVSAGADFLVMGNAMFMAKDRKKLIKTIQK